MLIMNTTKKILKEEAPLFVSLIAAILVYILEHSILQSNTLAIITLIFLFVIIMLLAIRVSHHAEALAEKYGDPYGTIILTLSAVIVEVVMIWIMMYHSHNPELARDTIVAAILLDLWWLLWLSAFIWWLIYWVQKYNIDSSNSYIAILIIAVVSAMVIPDFLPEELIHSYEFLLIILFLTMTFIFYRIQTITHSWFFRFKKLNQKQKEEKIHKINWKYHILFLILSIIAIWMNSEFLSVFMSKEFKNYWIPIWLWAIVVAMISASPEFMTAIKSAKKDDMQTVVNIAFWAASATVLLTVPCMIILSYFLNREIDLWITVIQWMLLWLIIILWITSFNDWKLNRLEGFIFLLVFIIYIFLALNWVS